MSLKLPPFEQLMQLAKEDPEQLERIRQQHVEHLIDSAPEALRQRLRGLQFQVDCQRRLHTSPMGACVEISRMMHNSLNKLQLALKGENNETQQACESAQVLNFNTAP